MTAAVSYGTSPIKRHRRTNDELESLRKVIEDVLAKERPATVRGVFYRASVAGAVPKTEAGYDVVQRQLVKMRREGRIPYGWITDNTRWRMKPASWSSLEDALENTLSTYRRAIWDTQDAYVEVWCEKDSVSGVLYGVTQKWDVPLMTARGFSSLSYLHSAAEEIAGIDKPVFLYYFGDHDPSGVYIDRKIEEELRDLAPDADIRFQRVTVLDWQIEEWQLPTRPTKKADSRSKNFRGDSVELEAVPPSMLRKLCRDCIVRHIDAPTLEAMRRNEKAERRTLEMLTRNGLPTGDPR